MTNTETENKYGLLPDMDWIDINKLVIDQSYQRDTLSQRSKNNITKIVKNFAWSKLTPLTVADIQNGTYAVIDGQHRLEAAKQLGDIEELPCYIIPATNQSGQADSFLDINQNRVAVNNYSIYKAKLAKGEKEAANIEAFLNDCNIEIPFNGYCAKPNHTLAIACIATHLRRHNDVYLKEAISLILTAYGDKKGQLKKDLLDTLVDFKIRNGAKAKDDIIIKALRSFDNADRISAKAKELKALDSSLSQHMAHYKVFLNKVRELNNAK